MKNNPFSPQYEKFVQDPTENIEFTDEQLAVIDSTANSIMVNSVAGSGKSSTLLAIAHQYQRPYTGLYLAFNKDIVSDIQPKLPSNWECKTFHSVGLSITKKHLPKSKVSMYKMKKLKIKISDQKMIDFHMSTANPNTEKGWAETGKKFEVEIEDTSDIINQYKRVIEKTDEISFGDMINYPIMNQWKSKHYDVLVIDESQDISSSQLELIKLIPHDRIVFVGDKHQQIYQWRSADPMIYDKIDDQFKPIYYNITQSFRCPDLILNEARKYVPYIWSDIEGGFVSKPRSLDLRSTEDECFILSRVNARLIRTARELIKNEIPFSINKQIVRSLTNEINKASRGCGKLDKLKMNLEKQKRKSVEIARKNNWNIESRTARFEALFAVIEKAKTIHDVKYFLNNLTYHSNSSSKRKLSTIHASKGLESKNVYLLDEGLCNSFIEKKEKNYDFNGVQEELNILYVAVTRSLNRLTILQ
jgi:superfamily I DNA/RNA helicase